MSRIKNAFLNDKGEAKKAFIGFITGGDPSIEKSEEFVMEMIRGGADLVEIGIPFSDPIAEGKVIQQANIRALRAGTTLAKIFTLVEKLRQKTQTPLVFLTYLNPVFHYGYEKFFKKCRAAGVDGIIIPDLPFEEQGELRSIAAACEVDVISLIAPTSRQRIGEIAAVATGFLYIVSSMGVTGIRSKIETDLAAIIEAAKSRTKVPAAVGFGINTPSQAAEIAKTADGVIVGSALVKIVEEYGEQAGPKLYEYVKAMKEAIA
ncbi:tryptophan synthase alpha chain [Spirochaetia bacterium]|nr:tryptophan synthase alpha chain [Spirochaetia bacterium]